MGSGGGAYGRGNTTRTPEPTKGGFVLDTRAFDWTGLLGQHRVIVIHTPILEWAGDYHAAALFEELVWRWGQAGRADFTVTDADLMAKLYMTRGALRGARARLAELGAVETVKRGMPPVLHYTVKPEAFRAPVEPTLVRNSPNDDAEFAQRMVENEPTSILHSDSEYKQSKGFDTSKDDVSRPAPNGVHPYPSPMANASPANGIPDHDAMPSVRETPRRRAKERRPPALGPGAILYRDVVHLTPNHVQRPGLDAALERHGEATMRQTIVAWLARGYNPRNVAGMIDAMASGLNGADGYARNGRRREADLSSVIL